MPALGALGDAPGVNSPRERPFWGGAATSVRNVTDDETGLAPASTVRAPGVGRSGRAVVPTPIFPDASRRARSAARRDGRDGVGIRIRVVATCRSDRGQLSGFRLQCRVLDGRLVERVPDPD